MVTAISLMPLSTISSILQTVPLFITFGAVLIFKEKVGWRRWSAIFIGFIGVILILKPGIDGFHLSSLVALLAVAFFREFLGSGKLFGYQVFPDGWYEAGGGFYLNNNFF